MEFGGEPLFSISLGEVLVQENGEELPESSPQSDSYTQPEPVLDMVDIYNEYEEYVSNMVSTPIVFEYPQVVFIVPYRNRELHKREFINKMREILEDYDPSYYKIVFVHQADTRSFNRGATKNIGFLYIKREYPAHYRNMTFVFNDVDTFPMDKTVIPSYETTPNTIKHFYGFTYTLGGIFSIRGEDFERINGFPNYWSWGFEDNSIYNRALKAKIHVDRTIFYPIGDSCISQLNEKPTRTLNQGEFDHYLLSINEGIKSIHQIHSYPTAEDSHGGVTMLNVTYFNTGREEDTTKTFETVPQRQPFGKKRRADIFRMNFT